MCGRPSATTDAKRPATNGGRSWPGRTARDGNRRADRPATMFRGGLADRSGCIRGIYRFRQITVDRFVPIWQGGTVCGGRPGKTGLVALRTARRNVHADKRDTNRIASTSCTVPLAPGRAVHPVPTRRHRPERLWTGLHRHDRSGSPRRAAPLPDTDVTVIAAGRRRMTSRTLLQ